MNVSCIRLQFCRFRFRECLECLCNTQGLVLATSRYISALNPITISSNHMCTSDNKLVFLYLDMEYREFTAYTLCFVLKLELRRKKSIVRLNAPRAKTNLQIHGLTLRLHVLWNREILLYYVFRFVTRALSVCLAK